MSIWFTIHVSMVSYQYMSYLCYLGKHLLRFILCYCTSSYKISIIELCFICNHHKTLLISQILNQLFCDFQTQFFAAEK